MRDLRKEAQSSTKLDGAAPGDVSTAFAPKLNEVPYFTPAERVARGRAARVELPRSAHAGWEPAPWRRNPIELLEEQAQTRLPELIAIRYGRMLDSPLAFYRGGASLMAADLAAGPRTGLHAQLCGDAHLSNFGVFAAPDRRLVFSINDFDETLRGPFEWDVKRLAASFAVAGREFGYDEAARRAMVTETVREYRESMANFAAMRTVDVWYTRLDVANIIARFSSRLSPKKMKALQSKIAPTRTKDSIRALTKLCTSVDGELRLVGHPPLVTPIESVLPGAEKEHLEDTIRHMIGTYGRSLPHDRRTLLESYRYVHAARKVVGVGSVGTRAWILLFLGRDESDPLFLQFKEAQASVLEPYLGRSEFDQHGQRVVEGQRMMQAASDIMLGWERVVTIDGQTRDFYIRQLWDAKASAEIELMDAAGLAAYGRVCGWTLARAHARSGDRIAIAAYLGSGGSFDRAMASFAEAYADQNERDYTALRDAVVSGLSSRRPGSKPRHGQIGARARHPRSAGDGFGTISKPPTDLDLAELAVAFPHPVMAASREAQREGHPVGTRLAETDHPHVKSFRDVDAEKVPIAGRSANSLPQSSSPRSRWTADRAQEAPGVALPVRAD